jgi:hypothetical protein
LNCFDFFKNLFCKGISVSKNKCLEAEMYVDPNTIVEFEFGVTSKCDHAGVRVSAGLLGIVASIHFYDTRHWDVENHKFYL